MSYALAMKSMNCISTTGRIPMCAAPAAAPTIAISEIGVSTTRASPNFASSPSVTLNAPPYAPMSSPRQKTFGSRSISSNNASRIASRNVTSPVASAIERPPARRALVLLDGALHAAPEPERIDRLRLLIDAHQRVGRLGHRRLLGHVSRGVDLLLHARVDRRQLVGLHRELARELPDVAVD